MPTCDGWYAGIHFKSFDAGLKTNRTLIRAKWPVNLSGSRWLWTRQATMGIDDTHTEKERQSLRSGFNSPKTISPIHCYDSCATELNGGDSGAAIFSLNGSLTVENATISDNFATGAGGGVVVVADPLGTSASVSASFRLFNTIISRNGSRECILEGTPPPVGGSNVGTVDANGSGNLILDNDGCPGVAVTTDPQLAALAVDKRSKTGTPTLALPAGSTAVDAGDDGHILATDQRGITRPQGPHTDIG